RIVYGGGNVGLMGLVADAALEANGEVVGVIPRFLVDLEVAHRGLTELRVVETMHDRKRVMAELADGFVVLSGGFGTLEEAIEVVTWRQLGLHSKPVVFLDVDGFWRPFVALVEHLIAAGFAHPAHATLFAVAKSVEEALRAATSAAVATRSADLKWT
ncbi:MAG: TIGR00730 family Rossman fold protein, partial [Candidatus Binatia bacterium]